MRRVEYNASSVVPATANVSVLANPPVNPASAANTTPPVAVVGPPAASMRSAAAGGGVPSSVTTTSCGSTTPSRASNSAVGLVVDELIGATASEAKSSPAAIAACTWLVTFHSYVVSVVPEMLRVESDAPAPACCSS